MRLNDRQGTIFDMRIEGYQYGSNDMMGESPPRPYSDCNWLMVRLTLSDPYVSHEHLRPFLNAHELGVLSHWFDDLTSSHSTRILSLVERNLHLTYSPDPKPCLTVDLSHERPPRHDITPWNSFPFHEPMTFQLTDLDLADMTDELHGSTVRFPCRNKPEFMPLWTTPYQGGPR
jgi:hypothetical protein